MIDSSHGAVQSQVRNIQCSFGLQSCVHYIVGLKFPPSLLRTWLGQISGKDGRAHTDTNETHTIYMQRASPTLRGLASSRDVAPPLLTAEAEEVGLARYTPPAVAIAFPIPGVG